MPPKNASKGGNAASKKTEQKKKEKIIEDKTFGLKNKKGAKQQKFIQRVEHQVQHGGTKTARELEKEREKDKLKKDEKQKQLAELNALFKPVQNLGKGADPKSVLCQFFKQGSCGKGNKCKFSHDLAIERKAEKRSIYSDARDEEVDTSNMTPEEMQAMFAKKEAEAKSGRVKSHKVCKHFLEAVENSKYGWFWNCPNGENCIFRHALPPGYILKKDRKKADKREDITLEELVDRERSALGISVTPVTLQTFLAWKKRKLKEKEEAKKKDTDKKKKALDAGKSSGLSGRELFTFDPSMHGGEGDLEDGDEDFDLSKLQNEPEDPDQERFQFKELDMDDLMADYQEVGEDKTGMSTAAEDRLAYLREVTEAGCEIEVGDEADGAVAIDEDLFDGDLEDLDGLEEELDELSVS